MNIEVLINVTPQETRVAFVENGVLQEVAIERTRNRGIVGNIYLGKVCRVLPGMEAAFVEIGLDRAAFLHASDVIPDGQNGVEMDEPVSINRLLHEGQQLLVQVVKDPLGTKGARLTTHVTIPSRYLVLMPYGGSIGVSTRIEDGAERERLRQLVYKARGDRPQGYILRTAAEGVSEQDLLQDMAFLDRVWSKISEREKSSAPGACVYSDLPLAKRTLRDMVGSDCTQLLIDSRGTYSDVLEFAESYVPEMVDRLQLYTGERPIFDLYNIEDEILKALERKVMLKSGGHLIFDQTESMTTIDVNTGGFVGSRNLEETIFKTNLEAAQTIARQLRLRNLGGIIIIDFIDMSDPEHRRSVMRALEKALEKDHARSQVCDVSPLGLVEMTRKRTRESLEHVLCEPCGVCKGKGYVKTAETACYDLFREILREARQYDASEILLLVSQEIVDLLLDEESSSLAELQQFIDIPIKYQVETQYYQDQFDVVPI
ncbi:MAG TPA: ribonuclease G [Gammaproteobacteria bacterium]|nr:ribonuclease G [Gammaproteobacteria bacterium]